MVLDLREAFKPYCYNARRSTGRQHAHQGIFAPALRGTSRNIAKDAVQVKVLMEVCAKNSYFNSTMSRTSIGDKAMNGW